MGKVSKAIGSAATGGLVGGPKTKDPNLNSPEVKKTDIDPDRGAQIAAAKKRKLAAGQGAGRSNLRIDLDDKSDLTRGGISIS